MEELNSMNEEIELEELMLKIQRLFDTPVLKVVDQTVQVEFREVE